MDNNKKLQKYIYNICTLSLFLLTLFFPKLEAEAVSFPGINITFDPTDESVIVDSIPANGDNGVEEKGPKTTISITLHKKDESTNWGPGLPTTTVEDYDLGQIKGKDKIIKVKEPDYTWSIYGKDIVQVPDGNISLKITPTRKDFKMPA